MKLVTLISFLLVLFGCSVQLQDPEENQSQEEDTEETTTAELDEEQEPNPNKGICSFSDDSDKGCLKANIAGTNLYIGEFYYAIGPKEMARLFAEDAETSYDVTLEEGHTLELTRRITQQNFYSNFFVGVEGSHTTYSAFHTGLGNLQINNMSPGYYNVQLSKEFEFRVLNDEGSLTGYKCAVIWATRPVDILTGEETSLGESISQFELRIFDQSCSGAKVKKKKKLKTKKQERESPEEEDTTDESATTSESTSEE